MEMRAEKRALDKIYKRRDRYDFPDWQREGVWDEPRRQLLIDSILRGWKLPKFYFLRVKATGSEYEVVDGQQRLTAIFDFLDNELSLSAETAAWAGATKYEDLPDGLSDAFDDFEIEYDEITDAKEEEFKEFFQRLQNGLPLTSSEKLNSVPSKLRDYCKTLSNHAFFKTRVLYSAKRYANFDVVSKVAALELDGLDTGLRFDDVKAIFEANAKFANTSATAKRLKTALDYVLAATPAGAKLYRNRTITQSILTLACQLIEMDAAQGKESVFGAFAAHFIQGLAKEVEKGHDATDVDFITFQKSINANVKSGARTRHYVLIRKLIQFAPDFVESIDAATLSATSLDEEIATTGELVTALVEDVNSAYASTHGKDLFKATNKTVAALNGLSKPISDYGTYKQFVENGYFLFWEGTGERLKDAEPESFKDLNAMRTDIQHDVDHGKAGKVKAKKVALGESFKRYSGVTSPKAAAPQRFPVAQLGILKALRDDLLNLLKAYS